MLGKYQGARVDLYLDGSLKGLYFEQNLVSIGSIFSSNKSKYNWDPEIYTSGFLNISGRTGCLGNLGKATSFYDAEGDTDVAGLT